MLIYARNPERFAKVRNLLERTEDQEGRYRNPDNDPRGPWLQGDNGTAKSASEGSRFPVTLPSGRTVVPTPSRGWSFSKETLERARAEGRAYFGVKGDGMPIIKRYLFKGFVLDDERFKRGADADYFEELLARIRDIRSSEKMSWRKVLDIYATSVDYDPSVEASQRFFATVQNKMHWAAHGHTAAALIALRVDASKPNAGLLIRTVKSHVNLVVNLDFEIDAGTAAGGRSVRHSLKLRKNATLMNSTTK